MLRINLLPPYIHDRAKAMVWTSLAIALPVVVMAALVVYFISLSKPLDDANQRQQTATTFQNQYNAVDAQITDANAKIADINAKQQFVATSQQYNSAWATAYEAVAQDVAPDILLNSMTIDPRDPSTVHLTGFCQSEQGLANWEKTLRNDSVKFQSVSVSLPAHPYPAGGGNANGMMGGGPGGFGGPGGYGGRGAKGSIGPSSMGGAPGGSAGPYGGMMGGSGGGFGGNSKAAAATPAQVEGRQGLNFTATLVLNKNLTPPASVPTWPAAASGGAAGGPTGMYGGAGMYGGGGSAAMMGGPGMMRGGRGGMSGGG